MIDQGYNIPSPIISIPVLGSPALSNLKLEMHQMLRGNYISKYDLFLGTKLGYVLCGGDYKRYQRNIY